MKIRKFRRKNKSGFSLVEIMVVIVIIGLLAAAVTLSVRSFLGRGRHGIAKMELNEIVGALDTFNAEMGRYPTEEEGLQVLLQPFGDYTEAILDSSLTDPWNHPYEYFVPGPNGEPYEVISFGADGREGGTGEDRDISSVDLKR
jgi:general secretion pathway protein G